jgi:hypothetical protein
MAIIYGPVQVGKGVEKGSCEFCITINDAVGTCALEIAEEMFCSLKVTLSVIGHELSQFTNGIGNVWSGASG